MNSNSRWIEMGLEEATVKSYNALSVDLQKQPRPELHSLVSRITETILAQAKHPGEPCGVIESTIGLKYLELCHHNTVRFLGTNAALPQLPGMSNSMTLTITGLTIKEKDKIALTFELDPEAQALVSSYLDDLPGNGTGQKVILHSDIVKVKESGDARALVQSLLNLNLRLKIGFTVQDLRILKFDSVGSEPFQMDPTGIIRPFTIASTTLYVSELNEVAFEAEVRHLFSQSCHCNQCYDHHLGEERSMQNKMELLARKFHLTVKNKNVSHHLRSQAGLIPQIKPELSKAKRNQENIWIQRDPRYSEGYIQLGPETIDADNIPLRNTTAFSESLAKYPPHQNYLYNFDSSGALSNTMRFSQAPDRRKMEKEIRERSGARFYPGFQLSEIPPLSQTQGATLNTSGYLDSAELDRSQSLRHPDYYVNIPDGRRLLVRDSFIGTVRNDFDEPGVQRVFPVQARSGQDRRDPNGDEDDRASSSLSPRSQQVLNNFMEKRDQVEEFINIISPINACDQKKRNKVLRQLVEMTSRTAAMPRDNAGQSNVAPISDTAPSQTTREPEVQFIEDQMNNMTISGGARTRTNNDYSGNPQVDQLCQNQNAIRNQQQGIIADQGLQPRASGRRMQLSAVNTGNQHVEHVIREDSEQPDDQPPLANSTLYRSVLEETMDAPQPETGRVAEIADFVDNPSRIQPTVYTRPGREVGLAPGPGVSISATQLNATESELDGDTGVAIGGIHADPQTDNVTIYNNSFAEDQVTTVRTTNQPNSIMKGSSGNIVLRESQRVLTSHCSEADREECQGQHSLGGAQEVDRVIPRDVGQGVSVNLRQSSLKETRGPRSDHEIAQAMSSGQVLATRQEPTTISMVSSLPSTRNIDEPSLSATRMGSVPQSTRTNLADELYNPLSNVSTINEDIVLYDSQDDTNSRTLVPENSRQSVRDRSVRSRNASIAPSGTTLSSTTSDLDSERNPQ